MTDAAEVRPNDGIIYKVIYARGHKTLGDGERVVMRELGTKNILVRLADHSLHELQGENGYVVLDADFSCCDYAPSGGRWREVGKAEGSFDPGCGDPEPIGHAGFPLPAPIGELTFCSQISSCARCQWVLRQRIGTRGSTGKITSGDIARMNKAYYEVPHPGGIMDGRVVK